MGDDYRGRMDIWFETLLFFVVINEVHLYRQLINTTCLELAKSSNKQLRLSCNNTSTYHCLLNGNSTKEFEICRTWKWIPAGNCTYVNTYKWNIDTRNCTSSAELACPKKVYRSENTTQFAACYVKKNTNATARQVRNTTCIELAKPSNQRLRLSCNDTGTYHCLLDQNYTKEYEICMMWKWIPKGKCAYFSMYSGSNIDERNCTSSFDFLCPERQYRSENTTNYSACYLRNNPTSVRPQTRIKEDKKERRFKFHMQDLPIILGIVVPLVSLAVIYFIFMHLKYVPLYRKAAYPEASQESSSNREGNEDTVEEQPFLSNEMEDTSGSPPIMGREDQNITEAKRNADPVPSQELSNKVGNGDTVEKKPVLKNEVEDTPESPPAVGHEHENMTKARRNEDKREEEKEENSTDSILSSCGVSKNSYNKKDDDE